MLGRVVNQGREAKVDEVDSSGHKVDRVDDVSLASRRRLLLSPLLTHAIHAFGKTAFFEKTLS